MNHSPKRINAVTPVATKRDSTAFKPTPPTHPKKKNTSSAGPNNKHNPSKPSPLLPISIRPELI